MVKNQTLFIALWGALVLVALDAGRGAPLLGQNGPATKKTVPENRLNDQETRGEGLFLQRCSLCHLPRKLKFGSPPTVGPSLSGAFKGATAEEEKALRQFILKGGPDMPGFQYGLEPKEMDDLVSYLKTL
jgi:mono/diheme cytochrome c family protein